ncbi:Sua5/YciO/YrdC/YwlC family protein [Spiroplasma tabanidicola]|uniref:L-threonylcarbamoyladenylate synthase n=1 Tax=Spiroplasma tabanidicola TaxID=324079 RepID=A0A6I6CDN4_9MOLU|nr:Sua5/YciO/YrdC/YwlC family protein [Spiroplasma tabanidicola]QGS52418.1 tRNA threonylcarbamoyladenosine biosynthesis protein [Spiroplasma tabanidicola]
MLLSPLQKELAIKLLKSNEIIILPTDTIYGLSALVSEENRIKINKKKNSSLDKPLIILVSSLDQASKFIDLNEEIIKVLKDDQPTTAIFKKEFANETYAIRLVKRKDICEIIENVGPIFSTSVNISNEKFLSNQTELENFIGKKNCFYTDFLDAKPSKILDFTSKSIKR